MTYFRILLLIDAALLVLMSLVTMIAFISDKKKAQSGKDRTKEKTLLGLTVLNGAFGAFIGRLIAHHKTDKGYFSLTIYVSMLLQTAVLAVLLSLAFVL